MLALEAQTKSMEKKANIQTMYGQLQGQIDKLNADNAARLQFQNALDLGNPADLQYENIPEKDKPRFVQGYGLANSEASAKEAIKSLSGYEQLKNSLEEMINLADNGNYFSTEDRRTGQFLAASVRGMLREDILGPGVVDKNERAILDDLIQEPNTLTDIDSRKAIKYKAALNMIDSKMNVQKQLWGLPTVKSRDKKLGIEDR